MTLPYWRLAFLAKPCKINEFVSFMNLFNILIDKSGWPELF